jgi:hypothetical protein
MHPVVSTIHVLKSGEIISSLTDYLKVEEKFGWVDRTEIVTRVLALRDRTDNYKKSVIVIYEEGHFIREYLHVEENFRPLLFC